MVPTSNKTTNLGLNNWVGTDKPKRSDFVEDNLLLDETVGGHILDAAAHFSAADREKWDDPVAQNIYSGTGAAEFTLNFGFSPKVVFVFCYNKSPVEVSADGTDTIANFGMATQRAHTAGISMSGGSVTVSQSQSVPSAGGTFLNLNSGTAQYGYLAFR